MKRDPIYIRIQELIMEGANLGNYPTNYTLISNRSKELYCYTEDRIPFTSKTSTSEVHKHLKFLQNNSYS